MNLNAQSATGDTFRDGAGVRATAPQEAEIEAIMVGPAYQGAKDVGPGATGIEMRAGRHADHSGAATCERVVTLLLRQEMRMALHGAGGSNVEIAVDASGVGAGPQVWMNAIHDIRVAGLPDADDASIADADVSLHDPQNSIDNRGVMDHHVQRPRGIGSACLKTLAVAHRLAGARCQFVSGDRVIMFNLGHQLGIAEADHVAFGGPEDFRIGLPAD